MLKTIKEFFMGKPVDVVAPGSAPYKVPEPAATTPIPLVVEPAAVVEVIISETIVAPVVVETAPAKAPRKPRVSKTAPVAKEKAPAKAKAPKLTVVKATKSKKA